MKDNKFFIIFFVLLALLLILIYVLMVELEKENSIGSKLNVITTEDETIKAVLENKECVFSSQEDNVIYLEFPVDLYDNNYSNNEKFFINLVEDLNPFFEDTTYYLVDNTKEIKVSVIYDYGIHDHTILYNDIENFFAVTDGKDYINIGDVKRASQTALYCKDTYFRSIMLEDGFFDRTSKELTDGEQDKNQYVNYLNNTFSVRLAANGAVKNIIYKDGYEGNFIISDITMDTKLSEILNKHPNPCFGSLNQGFLGYRSEDFYSFYYDDEISIYFYAYTYNSDFENLLLRYVDNRDLKEFSTRLSQRMGNYDYYQYDEENQNLILIYASRGIYINIKENNLRDGITLYSNYYFTKDTKNLIKNGYMNYDEDDLVNVIESQRRNNELNINY